MLVLFRDLCIKSNTFSDKNAVSKINFFLSLSESLLPTEIYKLYISVLLPNCCIAGNQQFWIPRNLSN